MIGKCFHSPPKFVINILIFFVKKPHEKFLLYINYFFFQGLIIKNPYLFPQICKYLDI